MGANSGLSPLVSPRTGGHRSLARRPWPRVREAVFMPARPGRPPRAPPMAWGSPRGAQLVEDEIAELESSAPRIPSPPPGLQLPAMSSSRPSSGVPTASRGKLRPSSSGSKRPFSASIPGRRPTHVMGFDTTPWHHGTRVQPTAWDPSPPGTWLRPPSPCPLTALTGRPISHQIAPDNFSPGCRSSTTSLPTAVVATQCARC